MFSSDKWFGAEAPFYSETIDQSLRFDDADNSRLSKTWGSAGNRKIWTLSWWMKRANIGEKTIFSAPKSASENGFTVYFPDDKLEIFEYKNTARTSSFGATTDMVFRDTTNWYHCVLYWQTDTYSSDADSVRLYVNGSQVTLNFRNAGVGADYESLWWNNTYTQYIGGNRASSQNFDGYIAEVNFIDGQALTADSFGETKNGVWIPKAYTGSYGTNGFRFTFADSSSLGDDTSSNTNDFATGGSLASTDVVSDSPTNNFANFSVLNSNTNSTLSEGGLRALMGGSGNYDQVRSDFGLSSGKWYWEVYVEERGYISSVGVFAGYKGNNANPDHWVTFGYGGWFVSYNSSVAQYQVNQNSSGGTNWSGATLPVNGDVIMIAIDVDNNKIWWGRNGTWYNSSGTANPATGTDARVTLTSDLTWHPMATLGTGGGGYSNAKIRMNFGQDSTFQGGKTAGTNSDENGIGLFQYAPPSGYLACCSSSLNDTTLSPNQSEQATDYFNTITYTGDNATSRSLTGVGFRPDWIWYKDRTNAYGYVTYDSSRSAGSVSNNVYTITAGADREKHLRTDGGVGSGTLAEGGYNDLYGTLTSFDPDGITIAKGDDTSAPSAFFNTSSASIVGWNWKCNGGTTSSNGDGTISSTVQVNTDAGFSIVLFTGDGNANATVGHGLGVKPAWYIVKDRDSNSAGHWMVWHHKFADVDNNLFLNLSNGTNNGGFGTGDPATTTTFEPSATTYTNNNGSRYVAYVFAEVEGYSKMGTYNGNSSSDGTFIYTGFRPAWILIKATHTDDWVLVDNKRDPHNQVNGQLFPSNGIAESTSNAVCDFLSYGFKLRRNAGSINQNTYVYIAFSDGQTAKFSNAR